LCHPEEPDATRDPACVHSWAGYEHRRRDPSLTLGMTKPLSLEFKDSDPVILCALRGESTTTRRFRTWPATLGITKNAREPERPGVLE